MTLSVCVWIRTNGTLPHIALAGRHHKPSRSRKHSGQGETRTHGVSLSGFYRPLPSPLDIPAATLKSVILFPVATISIAGIFCVISFLLFNFKTSTRSGCCQLHHESIGLVKRKSCLPHLRGKQLLNMFIYKLGSCLSRSCQNNIFSHLPILK